MLHPLYFKQLELIHSKYLTLLREALYPSGSEEKLMCSFVRSSSENNSFLHTASEGCLNAPVYWYFEPLILSDQKSGWPLIELASGTGRFGDPFLDGKKLHFWKKKVQKVVMRLLPLVKGAKITLY